MGQGRYTVAQITAMMSKCAPDARMVQRGHHYRAVRGSLRYTNLPKGSGPTGEPPNKVHVEDGHVRALVRALQIDEECARKHLPFARI